MKYVNKLSQVFENEGKNGRLGKFFFFFFILSIKDYKGGI